MLQGDNSSAITSFDGRKLTAVTLDDFGVTVLYRDEVCIGIYPSPKTYDFASNISVGTVRCKLSDDAKKAELAKLGCVEAETVQPADPTFARIAAE